MRDRSDGPVIDATDMFEKFQRRQEWQNARRKCLIQKKELAQMTDLEKAYFVGYREGFNRAKNMQQKVDELVGSEKESRVDLETMREIQAAWAEVARLRATDAPETRLNQYRGNFVS